MSHLTKGNAPFGVVVLEWDGQAVGAEEAAETAADTDAETVAETVAGTDEETVVDVVTVVEWPMVEGAGAKTGSIATANEAWALTTVAVWDLAAARVVRRVEIARKDPMPKATRTPQRAEETVADMAAETVADMAEETVADMAEETVAGTDEDMAAETVADVVTVVEWPMVEGAGAKTGSIATANEAWALTTVAVWDLAAEKDALRVEIGNAEEIRTHSLRHHQERARASSLSAESMTKGPPRYPCETISSPELNKIITNHKVKVIH